MKADEYEMQAIKIMYETDPDSAQKALMLFDKALSLSAHNHYMDYHNKSLVYLNQHNCVDALAQFELYRKECNRKLDGIMSTYYGKLLELNGDTDSARKVFIYATNLLKKEIGNYPYRAHVYNYIIAFRQWHSDQDTYNEMMRYKDLCDKDTSYLFDENLEMEIIYNRDYPIKDFWK